jgi:hypothetical protein
MTRVGVTVDIRDYLPPEVPAEIWDPTVTMHGAVISDGDTEVGSVFVTVSPRDSVDVWTATWMDEADAGWLVEFHRVEIKRDYVGHRYGLCLVAETLTQLTRGRTCLVTLVAEPRNWESLKQRDRGPALAALDRHWSQLRFDGGEVRPDDVRPRLMRLVARDYRPPEIHVIPITW